MNKAQVIAKVASKTGYTQEQVKEISNTFLSTIINAVDAGEKVTLTGFGLFSLRNYAARTSYHPRTKEKIDIKGFYIPVFYPSKSFKQTVRKEK